MSGAVSPSWRSVPGEGLTKRQRATVRANWQDLCEYLAAPGIAWEWGESGLSERLKHYLRHHGLIVRDADDQDCWQTTERLWVAVIEDAGDDETVGASSTGQCKLPAEAQASSPARRSGATTTRNRSGVNAVQATLTGDTVGVVNDEEGLSTELVDRNLSKGTPGDRADAAGHDEQTALDDIDPADVVSLGDGSVTGLSSLSKGSVRVAEARQDDGQTMLTAWGVSVDTASQGWCVTVDASGSETRLRQIDA